MPVGGDTAVKVLLSVNDADADDEPLLLQLPQVPVDGAQAQLRKFASQAAEYPLRRGVDDSMASLFTLLREIAMRSLLTIIIPD